MSTIPDPVSPTATDPLLCGICPNPATITCEGCDNMKYCSATCQQRDAAQHNLLCSSFKDFQERPSPNHFRAIYFPVDEARPRFVWLRMTGPRRYHHVDQQQVSQLVSGQASGRITITSHFGMTPEREYKNTIIVQHDGNMFGNGQPINLCLFALIGQDAVSWRGEFLAHAYKYRGSMEPEEWDPEDLAEPEAPLIALDMDTTSLGPLIAYFQWYIEYERRMATCGFEVLWLWQHERRTGGVVGGA